MTEEIHPIELLGNWQAGWALDIHTISCTYMGLDPSGRAIYDTVRSPMGEMLFRLKYRHDKTVIPEMVRLFTSVATLKIIDVIVPVPPSNTRRQFQPVLEVALAVSEATGVPVLSDAVKKRKATSELKTMDDPEDRRKALSDAFSVDPACIFKGQTVLLFDDLYRSGITLTALTDVVYTQGQAEGVKVITLTKTRSNR